MDRVEQRKIFAAAALASGLCPHNNHEVVSIAWWSAKVAEKMMDATEACTASITVLVERPYPGKGTVQRSETCGWLDPKSGRHVYCERHEELYRGDLE